MTGRLIKIVVAAGAALALVGGAAATPSAGDLTLQAADLAGAKLVSQGSVKEQGYVGAYQRTFQYSAPTSTGLLFVQSETLVAPTPAKATSDMGSARRYFSSKTAHTQLAASLAKELKVKPKAVSVGATRSARIGDQGFEIPVSVKTAHGHVYESIAYFRIDAIVSALVEAGIKPVTAAATARLEALIAAHIGAALAPVDVAPPTVTGTAQQGQTLTAAPGTWSVTDTAFTYQWQHCDATGANCVAIAGATAPTYAVTAADVNTTLNVVVTATNRFGTAAAPSAPTPVVT